VAFSGDTTLSHQFLQRFAAFLKRSPDWLSWGNNSHLQVNVAYPLLGINFRESKNRSPAESYTTPDILNSYAT
jgi:hypothetical protein